MLSFELSAIDLILAIAVIILLVLYITKLSAKPPSREKFLVRKEGPSEKPATEAIAPEEKTKRLVTIKPKTGSVTCLYDFGYLRKLEKGAPIPEECLGCPRIMECRNSDE